MRPRLKLLPVFFLMMAYSIPVSAQADLNCTYDVRTAQYATCMAEVFAHRLTALQAQLDQSYQEALKKVPQKFASAGGGLADVTEQLKQHFAKIQSAWRDYAKEVCAYEGDYRGKDTSSKAMFTNRCLVREFTARIETLKNPTPPQQEFP